VGTRALAGDTPSHTTQTSLKAGLRHVATSGGSRLVAGHFRGGIDEYATTRSPRQGVFTTFSHIPLKVLSRHIFRQAARQKPLI
jgi:hypothetical protein